MANTNPLNDPFYVGALSAYTPVEEKGWYEGKFPTADVVVELDTESLTGLDMSEEIAAQTEELLADRNKEVSLSATGANEGTMVEV